MSPTLAPRRTPQQRLDALRKANDVRVQRASTKRMIRERPAYVLDVLKEPVAAHLQTMKAYDLLMAVPKFGRVKVIRILSRHRVSTVKTVGGLSDRQRADLRRELSSEPRFQADPFARDAQLSTMVG